MEALCPLRGLCLSQAAAPVGGRCSLGGTGALLEGRCGGRGRLSGSPEGPGPRGGYQILQCPP